MYFVLSCLLATFFLVSSPAVAASHAGKEYVPAEFVIPDIQWQGFCHSWEGVDEELPIAYYSACFTCRNQYLLPEKPLFGSGGLCEVTRGTEQMRRALGFVRHVRVSKDHFVVGGDRAVEVLLWFNASTPCKAALLDDANTWVEPEDGTRIHQWQLAVDLLYTQYGEKGAWPMPDKRMQRDFVVKFGQPEVLDETHRLYLAQQWQAYLEAFWMRSGHLPRRWVPNAQQEYNEAALSPKQVGP